MSLTIVYGTSGSGKSEYVLKETALCAGEKNKAIIIVPEQFSHKKEEELIKRTGYITDDIKATSFKRLAHDALKNSGELKRNPDRMKKNMLCAKAVYAVADNLTVFGNVCKRPGFLSVIQDMISDFKRSCVTPADVLNMSADKDISGIFKAKLEDLGIIYEKYQSLIGEKFADDDDNVSYFAELIEKSENFRDTNIYIDEFFRFTIAEYKVIEAFLKAGASVTVTLCTPVLNKERSGIFAPVVTTYGMLKRCAQNCGANINPPVFLSENYRFSKSPELKFLESEFPKFKYNIYNEETRDISIFSASDIYSEVMHVACSIAHSVKNGDIRYRDVAVICGDTENYKSIVKTVFEMYDIPIFLDTKRDLLSHPVIIMVFSVFDFLINGLETKHILSYMKSGYSSLTREETDILENFILSGNVRKADWTDDERFLKRARSVFDDSEDLKEINSELADELLEIKNKLLNPLLKLKEKMMLSKKINYRVETLFSFFDDISLFESIENQVASLIEKGENDSAEEYTEVYNILMQTAQSLIVCLNGESVGLERMYDIICAGFSECKIGIIPPINDGVFFGDLSRSIARNTEELYIIGAFDGAFPPKAPLESVLNDAERIVLSQKGMVLAPDTTKIVFDYDFMVYNTINISKGKLHISYPVADFGGEGLRPSPLISKIRRIFPKVCIDTDINGKKQNPEKFILSKKSAFTYLIGKSDMTDEELKIYSFLAEDEKYKNMLDDAQKTAQYSKNGQSLEPDVVKMLYSGGLKGSVSSFEKYSGCPFAYFLTYGLSVKERKLFDIDTPDFGSLLHRVIDIFSKRVSDSDKGFAEITKDECENMISEILDEIVSKMFIKKLYSERKMLLLIKRLKKYAFCAAWAMCSHIKKGDFVPCAFEAEFSENGEMEPVVIELPTGDKITLIGKIDRIDKYEKDGKLYVKVIDYKTGSKEFSLSDIYNKLSLQLCVYITAVCENGDKITGGKANPAGMFYFKLSDKSVKTAKREEITDEKQLEAYKMSGIVLEDKEIIDAMERGIKGTSKILPVRIDKNGEISDKGSKTADSAKLNTLKNYVKKVAGEIGREILEGKVDILPCSDAKKTACDYCKFHSVCAFDENEDNYRQIGTVKDEVVWELMEE